MSDNTIERVETLVVHPPAAGSTESASAVAFGPAPDTCGDPFAPLEGSCSAVDLAVLHGFVSGPFSQLYARQTTDIQTVAWCPEWWEHPEAVARLHVLMRTFFVAASDEDPAVMSAWWLDHADPHMARLLDPEGVFRFCSPKVGHRVSPDGRPMLAPLPSHPLPAHLGRKRM